MEKSKRSRKLVIAIISIALAVCILTISCGGLVAFYKKYEYQFFLAMPTSYICEQIEKEIPIGSDADDVIAYLKSKDEWLPHERSVDKNYRISQTATGHYVSGFPDFYSFSKLDYESHDQGCYITSAYIGTFPKKGTTLWSAYEVKVVFVYDENLKLIDIYVYRRYAGF